MEAVSSSPRSPWVQAMEGFAPVGVWEDALCFHSGLMGGDSLGNPHGPLCALVVSRAAGAPCAWAAAGQCPHCCLPLTLSLPHCHHPFVPGPSLCEAADGLWSRAVSELLTLLNHFACEQHWSRDGPNEWPMSKWRCGHHVVFLRVLYWDQYCSVTLLIT